MTLTALFLAVSSTLSISPGLLESVCFVESAHNPASVHVSDGAGSSLGICQIKLSTARMYGFRGTEQELMKPEVNIYYAGQYLKAQITRYHSIVRGVCAYNRGKSTGDGWNRYTRKVYREWDRQRHQERRRNLRSGD